MSKDLEDLGKLREKIHDERQAQKNQTQIDDQIALRLGCDILEKRRTQKEFTQIVANARQSNLLSLEGRRLTYLIRLSVGNARYLPKRERDRIRQALDEYDKIDPEPETKEKSHGPENDDQRSQVDRAEQR